MSGSPASSDLNLKEALLRYGRWELDRYLIPEEDTQIEMTTYRNVDEAWSDVVPYVGDGRIELWARKNDPTAPHEKITGRVIYRLSVESLDWDQLAGPDGLKLYDAQIRESHTGCPLPISSSSPAANKDPGGRPPVYDWGTAMDSLMVKLLMARGLPETKDELIQLLIDEVDTMTGARPSEGGALFYLRKNWRKLYEASGQVRRKG